MARGSDSVAGEAAKGSAPSTQSAITRRFLDWRLPALPQAAQWLCEGALRDGEVDLSGVIVVLPGSRAGRRLLELLVDAASHRHAPLIPPQIATVGRLPELLYVPKRPFASELVQQLAWIEAIQALRPDALARLLPHPPAKDDFLRWLALGELLQRQYRELAADNLSFADVAEAGAPLDGFSAEKPRWQTLRQVHQKYPQRLEQFGKWGQ